MAKKDNFDPTWRYEELWSGGSVDLNGPLDVFVSKIQGIQAEALLKNPKLERFTIQTDFDEYSISISVHAERPETEEEILFRLGKHPTQIEAKKKAKGDFEVQAKAEVRRLCKKLKIQSPV